MVRAPDWSIEQFETVLKNSHLSSEESSRLLPQRSRDAVEIIRQGIHSFHLGRNVSMLSKMMLRRLEEKDQSLICPICGKTF